MFLLTHIQRLGFLGQNFLIGFTNSTTTRTQERQPSLNLTSPVHQGLINQGRGIANMFTLRPTANNGLPQEAQEMCRRLNDWAQGISDAGLRNEIAMHVLFMINEKRVGNFYLSYNNTNGQFSYRNSFEEQFELGGHVDRAVESICSSQPNLVNNIREAVQGVNAGNANARIQLGNHLLAFIAAVENQCPQLNHDMPGWAGNYIRDFFDSQQLFGHSHGQGNCVHEASMTAHILRGLQRRGVLPATFAISPEGGGRLSRQAIQLQNPNGNGEDHYGVMIALPGNQQMIIDTWMSHPGQQGRVFNTMRDWHEAFHAFTTQERAQENDLRQHCRTPAERNRDLIRNDFIFLRFFARSNEPLPAPLYPMFNYMRDRIIRSGIPTNEETSRINFSGLQNTPAGWQTLRPFIQRYYETMYPNCRTVREAFSNNG